jgi:hypothetical protein
MSEFDRQRELLRQGIAARQQGPRAVVLWEKKLSRKDRVLFAEIAADVIRRMEWLKSAR